MRKNYLPRACPCCTVSIKSLPSTLNFSAVEEQEILRAIAKQDYDVLRSRPVISKPRKAALLLRAFAARLTARQRCVNESVEQAYAACETIARREAKNFYYAFRALPKPKRAAVCAVYAFMRHADDLADDERLPREQRLLQSQQWLEQWHHAAAGAVHGQSRVYRTA